MINKISHCTNRTITDSFKDIKEVVEFIRNPPPEHLKQVEYARSLERGSEEYKTIKISRLPAVTINFNFSDNYILGKNVAESTGYLYMDVDGMIEQDLEINKTYVCAYWRSLSNTGLTLVVKVEGLTPDNFKIATQEIAKLLDLPFDKRAISIDRLTVLSYDTNAYYNDNVDVFPVAEMIPVELVQDGSAEKSTHYNTINTNSIGYDCNGYKLRFNNLDELLQSYDIVYDEHGFYDLGRDTKLNYAQIFVPFKKVSEGNRENILKSITYQLVALNKEVDRNILLKYLYSVNSGKMNPPLKNNEVMETFEKVYRQLNGIKPIINAERRFIYDKAKKLSPTDKRKLNLKKINQDRKDKTISEILNIMQEWDYSLNGKITIKKLCEATGKNRKTIQTYYKGLKTEISVKKYNSLEVFKKAIERNPLLKDLDDLMRYDLV
ncbi:BT4734/BF3469 family protein [Chryseobacterium sp.]|uniref:BT4734/BF3469 family protein n=1 Tax=Chryseobacterium sp. TaxID=1871047 RepID=UPI002FC6C1ED